ncbi:hypothetical protein COU88_01440 [Candidatus Roizmanbacteria bacterium CG10_big_fil_rev_8_21_14_0_10_39_6]|uniref:Uncharacterized protein n=1 Tax=Candidatus Roizmanbacteria bacterium CG10_big_fil_rev_8_21_14_0_10_39_6 TaxID=1974853 RepID=A0A2M8KT36_9BACT|nr:MAG: hypothetical protein COU88_01440 [Candidatus Roizmanbacteria bacterium CG10_big_fil_rev_8_21_14_0_10_39_6]
MLQYLNFLPKEIAILIILSPLFIVVFLLAYILKRGSAYGQKFPLYWLLLTIIGIMIYLYGFINDSISKYHLATFPVILISAFETYQELNKKAKKK